jgi:serine/threonine-protein kinase RsbW
VTGAYPVLHVGSFGPAGRVRPTRPWTRTFRGVPASVPEARRFVAELLAGCPAREVLMTCVSEFSANAIRHSDSGNGGVFIVEIDLPRPGVARIAVTDEGGPSLPVVGSLDLTAEGGRGLAMVAACTNRWGYADAYPGRTVWAEACWPVPVPSPDQDAPSRPRPAPAQDAPSRPRPAPAQDAPRRPVASSGQDAPRQNSRRSRLRFSPDPPSDWPPGPAA